MMIDQQLFSLIAAEKTRQQNTLELIASENYVSAQVQAALGSCLTNKYAEGYPGRRYYGGCMAVDQIENLCRERACRLFNADHANVQPHSGSQANMAAYAALLKPGDKILAAGMNSGGHLTHSGAVSFVTRLYNVVTYEVDPATGMYDYDAIREIALRERPRLIVCGASAYSRTINFERFRKIADETGAYLMADMAHIAGLVAAGMHPSPVPCADIVTSTTHKTLRGPRGGLILCKKELAAKVDKAVFPLLQGGPLMHVIAAKAACFEEASTQEFAAYQARILLLAKAMANQFEENGVRIVSGSTDNHMMLVDLRGTGWTGKQLEAELERYHIAVNKNMIPGDPLKPAETSGIRIGTAAMATRGITLQDVIPLTDGICDVILHLASKTLKSYVEYLCSRYPTPGGFI